MGVAALSYLPIVLTLPIYEGKRLIFVPVSLGFSGFLLAMGWWSARGRTDASVWILSILIVGMTTVFFTSLSILMTTLWVMCMTCMLSYFVTRPRQVLLICAMVLASLGWGLFHLSSHVSWEPLVGEMSTLGVAVLGLSLVAYYGVSAYEQSLNASKRRRDATSAALCEAQDASDRAHRELARAERADASRARFLASMSHELRTPLNAVLGYAELLGEELGDAPETPEEVHEDIERIQIASRHLLELLQDVMDLSEIEADELHREPRWLRLPEMGEQLLASMELVASSRANTLELVVALEEERVYEDPRWIRQILFNLMSNASKFTRDGLITLRLAHEGDALILEVRDTGVGMTGDQTAKIFEAFVQAEDDTLDRFGGTGLGLSLVNTLAVRSGGEVCLESEPGVGTVVAVRLPRAREVT